MLLNLEVNIINVFQGPWDTFRSRINVVDLYPLGAHILELGENSGRYEEKQMVYDTFLELIFVHRTTWGNPAQGEM